MPRRHPTKGHSFWGQVQEILVCGWASYPTNELHLAGECILYVHVRQAHTHIPHCMCVQYKNWQKCRCFFFQVRHRFIGCHGLQVVVGMCSLAQHTSQHTRAWDQDGRNGMHAWEVHSRLRVFDAPQFNDLIWRLWSIQNRIFRICNLQLNVIVILSIIYRIYVDCLALSFRCKVARNLLFVLCFNGL